MRTGAVDPVKLLPTRSIHCHLEVLIRGELAGAHRLPCKGAVTTTVDRRVGILDYRKTRTLRQHILEGLSLASSLIFLARRFIGAGPGRFASLYRQALSPRALFLFGVATKLAAAARMPPSSREQPADALLPRCCRGCHAPPCVSICALRQCKAPLTCHPYASSK